MEDRHLKRIPDRLGGVWHGQFSRMWMRNSVVPTLCLLDSICSVARRQAIFFLWLPYPRDPKDDLVLEAALAGECQEIVTFNTRDFDGIERFGLWVETPREFLLRIGDIP